MQTSPGRLPAEMPVQAGLLFPPVDPAGVRLHVITTEREWLALRPDWEILFAACPTASPALAWDWLDTWRTVFGPVTGAGDGALRIVTVRRDGRLVGALPLYESPLPGPGLGLRRLAFLGSGEPEADEICSAYLDALLLPGEGGEAVRALREWLHSGENPEWELAALLRVPAASPLLAAEGALLPCEPTLVWTERRTAYVADLSGGFEGYLQALSRNSRKKARQLLRRVEETSLRFEVAGPLEGERFLKDLVALHQQRWTAAGHAGCFASERFARFHRKIHWRWVPQGRAVLARLAWHGKPLAVLSGFLANGTCYSYLSGVCREEGLPVRSPGVAADLLLMAHLAGQGVCRYNLLDGTGGYKASLATETEELVDLWFARVTVRTALQFAARRAWRAMAGAAGRSSQPGPAADDELEDR